MNLLFSNDRLGEYPPSLYAQTRDVLAEFPVQQGEARAAEAVVRGLARSIATTQSAESTTMAAMLVARGGSPLPAP